MQYRTWLIRWTNFKSNNENLYNLGKFLKFPLNDLKNIIIENNLDLEDKLFNHNKINIIKENKDDFSFKFHLDGLNKIKSGKLKNEEIIDFINKDKYFLEEKYANQNYRKLAIVEGLDFDNSRISRIDLCFSFSFFFSIKAFCLISNSLFSTVNLLHSF